MARGKFQTLTEQMFYILLCLRQERCGTEIVEFVDNTTAGRVPLGPGTLYTIHLPLWRLREASGTGLLDGFKTIGVSVHSVEEALEAEARRLRQLTADYERLMESEGGAP